MGKIPPPPSPLQQPLTFPPPPPQTLNLDTKITPNILLIIIIIAIIFFISGLLHLLIRLLLRPIQRNPIDLNHVTSLQGQLQQLFHLHDSGVDQSFIDNTLPLFFYKEIIGNLKEVEEDPFDCAVCLCEFESHDKLRLLPKCSHAFHMDCIDTWLLSHSTCPLCRSSLLQDYGGGNNHGCSLVCVLESNSVESGRISVSGSNPHLGLETETDQFSSVQVNFGSESKNEEKNIVNVKLGKFRNEGSSEINNDSNNINNGSGRLGSSLGKDDLGSRRCYSMGSFAYVLDEKSSLQVPIRNTPMKKQSISKKANFQRLAMSEYGNDSQREFKGIGKRTNSFSISRIWSNKGKGNGNGNGNENEYSKRTIMAAEFDEIDVSELGNDSQREFKGIGKRTDSFSISRIWSKKRNGIANEHENGCSKRTTIATNSEFDEIDVSELGNDVETQSCYSVDSLAFPNTSSSNSNTRTLLWLMGRQNKIVHNHSSSLSSNV